jgi:2-keto-4-pentenoate hydratase/2-oxohepta-3-ene-1,7-dioic acid hydratase in catechol pathway
MRIVAFTLPGDPVPRSGVLAHDGARVVDLTEIGVGTLAEAAARVPQLARVAAHLLHVPGAVAHQPAAVQLLAPVERLVAVYDARTGEPAPPLAATSASAAASRPLGPGEPARLSPDALVGVGVACVLGRPAASLALVDVEAHVAGLTLLVCWRVAGHRSIEAAAAGPWLVTLDELADGRTAPLAVDLTAVVALNGEPLRGGSWAPLTAKLAPAVADASARAALQPGDAVAVATFELAGDLLRPDATVLPGAVPGDEVVLEVEHLGLLRARVAPGGLSSRG